MSLFDGQNIVHLAALLQLTGFVFKDQVVMRGLLVTGSLTYVAYYLLAPDTPLWGGIFWSGVFAVTNITMVIILLRDRRIGQLDDDEGRLFAMLDGFSPGEFRRLVAMAERGTADDALVVTRQDEPLEALYFITTGGVVVRKGEDEKYVAAPVFIGEVAFLLSRPASATVTLTPGTRYLHWQSAQLRSLWLRSPSLRVAFSEALNRDMAAKVQNSALTG